MVSNETWGGMVAMNMQMFVHCARCERSVEIDMTKLPPDGKALGQTFRCGQCGSVGAPTINHRSALRAVPGTGGRQLG